MWVVIQTSVFKNNFMLLAFNLNNNDAIFSRMIKVLPTDTAHLKLSWNH